MFQNWADFYLPNVVSLVKDLINIMMIKDVDLYTAPVLPSFENPY